MASPQPRSEAQERAVKTKHELPGPVGDILTKSLQIGASAGACGLLFGATAGIVRGTTPVLFSLASGFQWFGLGSIYYGTRALTIASHGHQHQITPSQKVEASALGGAVSGTTMGGIFRGPRNILPAALVFSVLGASGQFAANKWFDSREASSEKTGDWLSSKWSPMKKLSDQEYEVILEENLLRLEAEIAIIDDNIAGLKARKEQQAKDDTKASPSVPSQKNLDATRNTSTALD